MTTDPKKILNTLKKMKPGESIAPEGPCGGLYALMSSPGESTIIGTGSEFFLILIDHDDSIGGAEWERCGWSVDTGGDRTTITILIPQGGEPYTVKLSLHHSIGDNIKFLRYLKSKRALSMHLLGILHGELVKRGTYRFTVPESIISLIEA